MRSSPDSSPSCWNCRLEWRPSRILVGALVLLGMLAAAAVMASGLAPAARVPVAVAAVGAGLVAAAREATRAIIEVSWNGPGQPASWRCGRRDERLHEVTIVEHGLLLCLRGRDRRGRVRRLLWWPDTLGRADRRALRLAAGVSRRSPKPLPPMAA